MVDKTLKIISTNNQVEITTDIEIRLICAGAYTGLKAKNVAIQASEKVEPKAADHPFLGLAVWR